jgi:hypothetical protein
MNERTGVPLGTARSAIAALLMVAALASTAPGASELRIEAETFEPYGYYDTGGYEISVAYCSYASGALAVDGLDVPDEWFKIKVTFEVGGCYGTRLDYQSDYEDTVQLAVRLLDYPNVGDELRADYSLVGGFGFG